MMKHTDQEWDRFIEDQAVSGLSIKEYSRMHGLGYSTFQKKKSERKTERVFQKVVVELEPVAVSEPWIEFVCAGLHMKVMRKDLHEVLRAVQSL